MTTIVIRDIPRQRVATIRARVPMSDIGPEMREGYGEIATAAATAGVAIDGLAFAIHHEIDAGKVDIEFGFPVTAYVESGRVHTSVLEGIRAACAMHEDLMTRSEPPTRRRLHGSATTESGQSAHRASCT